MSSQPKIRYPSGYKLPDLKVKVNPSQSKVRYGGEGDTQNTPMVQKVRYGGEGDTQNTPMMATTTPAFSVNFTRRNYSEFELLDNIQLMISQLQYNVFHQKCVSDKMLALHPRDLDITLQNDLWRDCFNYTLHIAVSFARHFQRVKDNRPKVHFRFRNSDRSYEERDNRPGTLTSAEIDLDQVGKCLYALDRVIQKYYADFPGQPSFSGMRSSRGLSGSLPRSKPGNRFDAVHPGPGTIGLTDMEAPLMRILNALALDKNSFPTEEAFSLQNVTIEPRASKTQISRQASNSSLTTAQNNYTNRNRMRSISISSDLSLSSTSETEPESNLAHSTPVMTSTSASATSSRRSGRYMSTTAGYRERSTNTTIDMNGDGDGTRVKVKTQQRSSANKKKIVEVKTKTQTTPMTPGTGPWSPDKAPVPRAPRAGYGQRRRGEYSV